MGARSCHCVRHDPAAAPDICRGPSLPPRTRRGKRSRRRLRGLPGARRSEIELTHQLRATRSDVRIQTSWWIRMIGSDAVGYLASALVLAAFCMKEMIPLRVAALGSNIAFLAYGLALGLVPVWLLHAVLLP